MLTFTPQDRRYRLVRRLHVGVPAASVGDAASALVAVHATDPASVYLALLSRCPDATIDDVTHALYGSDALVRMLAMRRTLFVLPSTQAAVVHAAASVDVAARLRRGLVKDLEKLPTDPPLRANRSVWLTNVEASVERALQRLGSATANELAEAEPRLRTALLPTSDKAYDVRRAITSRVLTLMGTDARIARGQPRGAWTSRAHVWEPVTRRWPDGLPALPAREARASLARLWLAAFGPALVSDLKWWAGWTLAQTKAALAANDAVDVDLDGQTGVALADDVAPVAAVEGAAALLPALDSAPMGWHDRDWFLGPHAPALFDRYGNIGPTVWWNGEIIGGWAVRGDGEVVWRMLADAGREAAEAVAAEADRLQERLAGTVVVPSFRTPLERELVG